MRSFSSQSLGLTFLRCLCLTSLGALARPAEALAQCRVLPGPEGEISQWLSAPAGAVALPRVRPGAAMGAALGTTATRMTLQTLAPSAGPSAAGFRPAVSNRTRVTLAPSTRGRGGRAVLAAITLSARSAGRRWLSLGADDALAVWLDGREIARLDGPRRAREDDLMVPLDLSEGAHRLVLVQVSRDSFDVFVRITDAQHRPDPNLRFTLDGVDDAACDALAPRTLALTVRRAVEATDVGVTAALRFPGGTVRGERTAARRYTLSAPEPAEPVSMALSLDGPSAPSLDLAMHLPDATAAVLHLRDEGSDDHTFRVGIAHELRDALRRAFVVLDPLDPALSNPQHPGPWPDPELAGVAPGSVWSVARTYERLRDLVAVGDGDAAHLRELAATLRAGVEALARREDPFAGRTGVMRRAYRSPLDGTLQEYSVYVPGSYRGDRAFPMVVGLHGLHGSAHRMLPVLMGLYDEHEDRTHAERVVPPLADPGAIVVAPYGYGDTGYRQQGEYDVLRVVSEMQRAYRVDPNRTYLTGLSMGGIGAAGVSLHNPGVFAAAAPLCGYHSYFVRGDTRGVRRPWETFLMELRSNDHWAENGRHLPMYIVHGTLDRPVSNSQTLVDRYSALGYRLEVEWPALGHNVWSQTYAEGRIFTHFSRYERDPAPRTLRFRTPDLRWPGTAWVRFDALQAGTAGPLTVTGTWGEIELTVDPDGRARGVTRNVGALTLTPPVALVASGVTALRVELDGDRIEVPVGAATSFLRREGHWQRGERLAARGGGAIREVFDAPMLFVVGSRDPSAVRLYERIARQWAQRSGVALRYPIVRDDTLTEAMLAGRNLVLIGTPRDHRLLDRWQARLPISLGADRLTVGARSFTDDNVGAVFTAPNPDDPARTVLVISGRSLAAMLRSNALPDLVPGYVVYDARVGNARGHILLGAASQVLAAGFFDREGRPLADDRDPVSASGPTDDASDEN